MWKIFQGRFDTPITPPTPRTLATGLAALATALALPAIIPNTSYFYLLVQTIPAGGMFIAGAHRTQEVRHRLIAVLPWIVSLIGYLHGPANIPQGLLLSYAAYTLGNAWKYWYLQQDPNRHNPHYRYFKDPNTRPQRHVIRGLLLAPSTFLIGGILGLIIQGLHLATRETSGRIATVIIVLLLLLSALEVVIGIVQLIRKALRRRSASTHPEHA